MANPFGAPGISVTELARRQKSGEEFIWLDVREPQEHLAATIDNDRVDQVPMSQLAAQQLAALPETAQDQDADIVVMCHHGTRSAQVVLWLRNQGWTNVINLDGGIDAWAREVDATVGTY